MSEPTRPAAGHECPWEEWYCGNDDGDLCPTCTVTIDYQRAVARLTAERDELRAKLDRLAAIDAPLPPTVARLIAELAECTADLDGEAERTTAEIQRVVGELAAENNEFAARMADLAATCEQLEASRERFVRFVRAYDLRTRLYLTGPWDNDEWFSAVASMVERRQALLPSDLDPITEDQR